MSLWSDITNTVGAVGDWASDVWDTTSAIAGNAWQDISTEADVNWFSGTSLQGGWLDTTTTAIGSFLDNPIIKAGAGYAMNSMFDKNGNLQSPSVKGARLSGSRQSAGSSQFSSSAADLGFTDRVQNAMRTIRNAGVGGGTIQDTVARLQTRPARGPLLDITAPQVAVRTTTKQSTD